MSTFGVFKHIVKHKLGQQAKDESRIDIGLPLNLKIGSMVSISEIPFIINSDKMLITKPNTDHIVMAIGNICISQQISHYKFYLEDVKNPESNSIVQISTKKDEVEDMMFIQQYDMIRPADEPGWELWLNEHLGLIGGPDFKVSDSDKNREETYVRCTPRAFLSETVIFDPYGEDGSKIENLQAIYSRQLDGLSEYCIVSREKHYDYRHTQQDVFVTVNLAIDLNKGEFIPLT